MTPEDHTREALRARVLAAAGAPVRFEELDAMEAPGRIIHYRIWVGAPGGADLYAGRTLAEAVDRFERGRKVGDPNHPG